MEQRTMLGTIQLNQILASSSMQGLPMPDQSLQYCQSLRKRHIQYSRLTLPDVRALEKWADDPELSLMLAQSGEKQVATDFTIDLLKLIQKQNFPVIWALRFPNYWDIGTDRTKLLRALLYQCLKLNPGVLVDGEFPLQMTQMQEASSEKDWLALLNKALTGIPRVFLVLDAELISTVTGLDRYEAALLVEKLCKDITTTKVKVIASTYGLDERYVSQISKSNCVIALQTKDPHERRVPLARRRQELRRERYRALPRR
jgi:hypothetical protein